LRRETIEECGLSAFRVSFPDSALQSLPDQHHAEWQSTYVRDPFDLSVVYRTNVAMSSGNRSRPKELVDYLLLVSLVKSIRGLLAFMKSYEAILSM